MPDAKKKVALLQFVTFFMPVGDLINKLFSQFAVLLASLDEQIR